MEPMRVLKYDGKGRTLAIVELDVEAIIDSMLDEIGDRCYDRSVAKVRLPEGKCKEVRWSRQPVMFVIDPNASKSGFRVGDLIDPEAADVA